MKGRKRSSFFLKPFRIRDLGIPCNSRWNRDKAPRRQPMKAKTLFVGSGNVLIHSHLASEKYWPLVVSGLPNKQIAPALERVKRQLKCIASQLTRKMAANSSLSC